MVIIANNNLIKTKYYNLFVCLYIFLCVQRLQKRTYFHFSRSGARLAGRTLSAHMEMQGQVQGVVQCRYCVKTFQSRTGCQNHERLHTGRTFNCTECSKVFTASSDLQRHIEAAHREPKFFCSGCRKSFGYQCNLRAHQRKTGCGVQRQHH